MGDKCNCYRFSPRDSLSGAVAQIADYLSKHPGWNETELRAFVDSLISSAGVETFNGRSGNVTLNKDDVNNLLIANCYFAEADETIESINVLALYKLGIRIVFTQYSSEIDGYTLAYGIEYYPGTDTAKAYLFSSGSGGGTGAIVSVNGKTGVVVLKASDILMNNGDSVEYAVSNAKAIANAAYSPDNQPPYPVNSVNTKTGSVTLKVVDVSNGDSVDDNAYIFIDETENYPDIIAPDSNKLGGQIPPYYATAESVNSLKNDVAAITPDDTVVDGKPWTSKKTVDSLCMPLEATGNPVQVYPVEGYPLGVKVSWEPTQAGEGDPSPENIRPIIGRDAVSVTRCEENLLNISQLKPEGYNLAGINTLKPNTTYTFKPVSCGGINFAVFLTDNIAPSQTTKQLNLTRKYIAEGESATFTTPSNADSYSVMWLAGSKSGINQVYPNVQFMLVAGTTAPTTYTPYIGQTNTLTLPETVYGGTLDVETGVVTVEFGHIASYAGESLPGEWISDRDVYASDATPTTGAQVVYKLATPYTIQLTPQQIAALSGVNTLYTDAGTLTVTGREDPRHTIVTLTDRIAALEAAAAGV